LATGFCCCGRVVETTSIRGRSRIYRIWLFLIVRRFRDRRHSWWNGRRSRALRFPKSMIHCKKAVIPRVQACLGTASGRICGSLNQHHIWMEAHPTLCHPDRRDLQFFQPTSHPYGSATLPFVIPTRSGGICSSFNQHHIWMEARPYPLSSRSEVEGSAVRRCPLDTPSLHQTNPPAALTYSHHAQ
jgi:hypothetical protein